MILALKISVEVITAMKKVLSAYSMGNVNTVKVSIVTILFLKNPPLYFNHYGKNRSC